MVWDERELVRDFCRIAKQKGLGFYDGAGRPIKTDVAAKNEIKVFLGKLNRKNGLPKSFGKVRPVRAKWVFCPSGKAITTFGGERFEHQVPARLILTGEGTNGKFTVKVFKRFISHPFYQQGAVTITK